MQHAPVQAFSLRQDSRTSRMSHWFRLDAGDDVASVGSATRPAPVGLRRRKRDFRPEAPQRIARYDSSPRNETRIHGARSESILHFSLVSSSSSSAPAEPSARL